MPGIVHVAVVVINAVCFLGIAVLNNPFSYIRRWQRRAVRIFALIWAVVNVMVLLPP